jgi:hypothetical protein
VGGGNTATVTEDGAGLDWLILRDRIDLSGIDANFTGAGAELRVPQRRAAGACRATLTATSPPISSFA